MGKTYFDFYSILAKSFDAYGLHWDTWISSHKCFLRIEEKTLIQGWVNLRNIKRMAEEFESNEYTIKKQLNRIASTLQLKLPKFNQWKHQFENGGYIHLTDKEKFLQTDLASLPISLKLYYNLNITHCENLQELLKEYTKEDLLWIRGFGKKTYCEFEQLLKNNQCFSKLKSEKKLPDKLRVLRL